MAGQADLAIAGGVEMMSLVPFASAGGPYTSDPEFLRIADLVPQGISADIVASRYGYTRSDVDSYAVASQGRAKEAWKRGAFDRSVNRQSISAVAYYCRATSTCAEAARRGVERRGRLADLLAMAGGKLLAHCLDQLEAARNLLQRLGHILADLRQPRSAAASAGRRSLDDDALALDVIRPGLAQRPLAREGAHGLGFRRRGLRGKLILGRRGDEFFELQLQLLDQPCRALGALPIQSAFELLDEPAQHYVAARS